MPQPLRAPSLLLGTAAQSLTPEERTDVTLVLEPTSPDISLDGAGHVAAVVSAGLRALASSTKSKAPALSAQIARLDRVSALLPDPGPFVGPVTSARTETSFWDVLRHVDLAKADPRLLRRIGAVYFEAASSFAKPQQPALRSLYAAIEAAETPRAAVTLVTMEQSTQSAWTKAVKKLTTRRNSRVSAAASLAEQRIERRLIGARSFTNAPKLAGFGDDLTGDEVVEVAGLTRRGAEGGDTLAYLVALAHWIGLWLWELMNVEVFGPAGAGLIRISDDCTHVLIELAGVFHDLAKAREGDFKVGTTILIIVLPRWIADWLRAMRFVRPRARTMTELTDFRPPRTQSRIPGVPEKHAKRLTVRRFIDARSQPMMDKLHQHLLAVSFVDFARAEKSSFPYHAVPQDQVNNAQKLRAEILGWGPLCEIPHATDTHVGSQNTPLLALVLAMIEHRRRAVQSAPHGPNAGWDLLVGFHNEFVRYVLLMCTLAWLLRGCLEHTLPASLVRLFRTIGFRDKNVPMAQCAPAPLVCGSLMRLQLQFLSVHAGSMADRVERLSRTKPELLPLKDEFARLAEGDADMALLQLIEGRSLRPAGAQDIAEGLDTRWRADALRHFGTDAHRELGTRAELIELLLRHAGNGFELFSTACGVSVHEWSIDAASAQDRLLMSLRADPQPGLVSKLHGGRQ